MFSTRPSVFYQTPRFPPDPAFSTPRDPAPRTPGPRPRVFHLAVRNAFRNAFRKDKRCEKTSNLITLLEKPFGNPDKSIRFHEKIGLHFGDSEMTFHFYYFITARLDPRVCPVSCFTELLWKSDKISHFFDKNVFRVEL